MELKRPTSWRKRAGSPLLIELYGIETSVKEYLDESLKLLIELYGIETRYFAMKYLKLGTFNRTIWN